jgi:hypothetical protein
MLSRHTVGAFAYAHLKPETSSGFFFGRDLPIPEDEMRTLVLVITACVVFGCTLGPVGAASLSRDRGSSDPSLRLFAQNVPRAAYRSRRTFVAARIVPALTVGIAF